MSFSVDVQHLQVAINRFAPILKLAPVAVDGVVGPKTFLRFQQLAASILAPQLYAWAFKTTGGDDDVAVDAVQLADYAGSFVDTINARADALHLTGTSADLKHPEAKKVQAEFKEGVKPNADHGDLSEGPSPWLIAGGVVLLAGAGVAVYLAVKKPGRRPRRRALAPAH